MQNWVDPSLPNFTLFREFNHPSNRTNEVKIELGCRTGILYCLHLYGLGQVFSNFFSRINNSLTIRGLGLIKLFAFTTFPLIRL